MIKEKEYANSVYLYSEIDGQSGHWEFELQSTQGQTVLHAEDFEPAMPEQRLALLTVVRALESLDGPSKVILVDCDRYICRGVRYGLCQWKASNWQWECFGFLAPVKNYDLWQRIDRALEFHSLHFVGN